MDQNLKDNVSLYLIFKFTLTIVCYRKKKLRQVICLPNISDKLYPQVVPLSLLQFHVIKLLVPRIALNVLYLSKHIETFYL